MEFKYWLLAVGVVVAMSYVSVEGAPGTDCTGDEALCNANETCNNNKCACKPAFKNMSSECVAKGYNDNCTTPDDCKSGPLGTNGTCTAGKCACMTGYSMYMSMCSKGYDDSCNANTDCQSGNLGDKGVCKNTTSKCGCMTGYSWKASMCQSDNGATGLTISITLILGALLAKKIC
ncbi:latent-transforming growth factor beta-binding protein 1-like isoform X2 [Mya arenaria]|uniref:latent-transforming growth factor beta-binding protein 1-like isoform X2 n=1 Tax=Mya arenaria TaxID=6604 RepID=UPI0022E96BE8|nr:latent-transforming growth factor beta-binding protein 1-like isoform X2 [Mya arenaria]